MFVIKTQQKLQSFLEVSLNDIGFSDISSDSCQRNIVFAVSGIKIFPLLASLYCKKFIHELGLRKLTVLIRTSCLKPLFGWGRLSLSEASMTKLLLKFSVYPQYFDFLRTFGSKDFAKDDAYSSCDLVLAYDSAEELDSIGRILQVKLFIVSNANV